MTMEQKRFSELVEQKRVSACSTCDTYEYQLPLPLTAEVSSHLAEFGGFKYPLDKVAFVKIDTDQISFQARLGRTHVRVKYKQKPSCKARLEAALANYLGTMMGIQVLPD